MFWNNHGILGINARNLLYIRPYNRRKAIKLADDKIKTKQFLAARDIPVPKLFQIIKTHEELEKFDFNSLPSTFVLKPNNGFGGEGILVITGKKDKHWITAGGNRLYKKDFIEHIQDIIDGRYSISNVGDVAFFEQLIITDDVIGKYSYKGLPDIRVVVHNLIPVMAMLRLPTRESKGKANLQMGGVGVGIDIAKGEATNISYKNKIIDELPDGKGRIRGEKIPFWDEILLISSKVQLITNLGYLAVDIALDKNIGPVLLEINARAGLKVQIANLSRLRKRLERIEGVKVTSPTKGIRIAKDMFGNIVEKGIKQMSGKEVIKSEEEIELITKKGTLKLNAKIDTGEERTILDEKTALKAGLLENQENYDDEKSTLKIKFTLKEKRIPTIVDLDDLSKIDNKIIIGKRDLSGFLVSLDRSDSSKKVPNIKTPPKVKNNKPKVNYKYIDQELLNIDSKIKLLYHLRPINLESEKRLFFENPDNSPLFEYPQLKYNPIDLIDKLGKLEIDESPLGKIFISKKEEILKKIELLELIDDEEFTEKSIKLFGKPSEDDYKECLQLIKEKKWEGTEKTKAIYNDMDAKKRFEKTFEKYKLNEWKVKIKENMVTRCVAGKNNRLFLREGSQFSREDIESLIIHEIETHIITAENGKIQPYEIFNRGLANYLITQEGLALYNVIKQRHISIGQNIGAIGNVVAIYNSLNKSFSEVYKILINLGIPKNRAFKATLKAKRGLVNTNKPGAFTKDHIYYKGYQQIEKFIKDGGDIKDLFIGKFNLKDLETIKAIPNLNEASMLPEWIKK